MKTIKILAHGGDHLIMLGKTDNLPAQVVSIFNDSRGVWDPDVTEKYQYLDRPVDQYYRLFIRYYRHSQPGKRALPYEVGFLLPREVYETAGNLQVLHEQLMQLSHDTLSKCWESSGELVLPILPMAETQETPNTSLSLDTPHLLCGDSQFDNHLATVGTSFVSSDINTWFTLLYLVVNPDEPVESANVTISRKWMEPSPQLPPQEPKSSPTPEIEQEEGDDGKKKSRMSLGVILLLLAYAVSSTLYAIRTSETCQTLATENQNLQKEIQLLKQQIQQQKQVPTSIEATPNKP